MKHRMLPSVAMLVAPVLALVLALAPLDARAAAPATDSAPQKQAPAQPKQASAAPAVLLQTNLGDIVVRLDAKKAPISTDNFLQYVRSGHYNGTIFHRVIKGFMIQGGGMEENLRQKPTRTPIRNEANNGLQNKKYTIAMARTNDPHSATSQFFINTRDNAFLNFKAQSPDGWGYAVFGKVIKGQDVVDKIEAQATGKRGFHDDVPKAAIVITKAEVIE